MMEPQALIISSLSISKSPGLPQGIPTYGNLSPNINLIIGPNGAGKTSTTRAIRALIWGAAQRGLEGEITLAIGSDTWNVRADGGRIALQRNAVDAPVTGLPAIEGADRYTLALHELVIDKGKELALEIRKQAAGGYDVGAAGRALGYSNTTQRRSAGPFVNWLQAEGEYKLKRREQEGVKAEEDRLVPLNSAKQESEIARDRLGWYGKMAAWLEARRKQQQAAEHLSAFDGTLAIMTGEESSNITELTEAIETADLAIQAADDQIETQEQIVQTLNLPETGVVSTDLTKLEEQVEVLEELERDLRDQNKAVLAAQKKEEATLDQLGDGKDHSAWKGLAAGNLSLADDHLRRHHLTLSEQQAIQQIVEKWEKEVAEEAGPPLDRLSEGVILLSNWLGSEGRRPIASWIPWALAVLGIGTAFTVVLVGPWGLVGIAVIVFILIVSMRKSPNGSDRWQREYTGLDLPIPTDWERSHVLKTAAILLEAIKEQSWQVKVQTMLEFHKGELDKLEPKLVTFAEERAKLEEKMALLPESPTKDELRNYSAIYLFLNQVWVWAAANRELAEAIGARDSVLENIEMQLSSIKGITGIYGLATATDGSSARANYIHLRDLDKTWQDAQGKVGLALSARHQQGNQKTALQRRLAAIYSNLGMEEEDENKVGEVTRQLPEFKLAQQESTEAAAVLRNRREELDDHSLYGELGHELDSLQLNEVDERRRDLATKAERLEQLNRDISQIEGKISLLKQGNNLEAALARKNEALDSLGKLYEDNLTAITGQLIVDELKQEMEEANQPAVYRRAKELFSRITSGRYELIPSSAGSDDVFRAKDTIRNWGQPLEELSSATRIQLLLAVRLAFIQEQERGVRLPLLADELLATTDDGRADAIIEALTVISQQGRQIFYFTAQKDEIIKWQNYLAGRPDVQVSCWELDGRSNEVNRVSVAPSDLPALSFSSSQPEPNERSHSEYGALLQVELFDLPNSSLSSLHLWYVIEDTQLLYQWLSRGFSRWGQLARYLEIGGSIPGWTTGMTASATKKIQLLERYQQLYRQGRSRCIDREVLDLSKAISERFMDAVVEKLRELGGNPRDLLAALRNRGTIPSFRVASADDLEQYLLEKGFIDELDIIAQDEITLRMQATLTGIGLQPDEAERFLNRIATGTSS